MKTLARRFMQGLLVFVPVVVTVYVVYFVITTLDGLVPLDIPGLGLAVTLVAILLVGFLTSSVVGQKMLDALEGLLGRLPIVKLLYSSLRDLMNAFVGDRRSFGKPVVVTVTGDVKVLGFLTCERFDDPQLAGHVAVYLPQSYNFAGNLLVVERERVRRIDADGAQFMAFVMSGGVAELNAAETMLDQPLFSERPTRPDGR